MIATNKQTDKDRGQNMVLTTKLSSGDEVSLILANYVMPFVHTHF